MELALELLSRPDEAFRKIKEQAGFFSAILCALGGWFSFAVGTFLLSRGPVSPLLFLVFFLAGSSILLAALGLKTILIHCAARISGGEGRIKTLFAMLAFCLLPLHLFLPLAVIARGTSVLLIAPFSLVLLPWMAILGFKAIRENYGFSQRTSKLP